MADHACPKCVMYKVTAVRQRTWRGKRIEQFTVGSGRLMILDTDNTIGAGLISDGWSMLELIFLSYLQFPSPNSPVHDESWINAERMKYVFLTHCPKRPPQYFLPKTCIVRRLVLQNLNMPQKDAFYFRGDEILGRIVDIFKGGIVLEIIISHERKNGTSKLRINLPWYVGLNRSR